MVIELGTLSAEQANQNLWLNTSSVSPGRGLNGREHVIFREARYWEARIDFRNLFFGDRLKSRAIAAQLRGKYGSLRVTIDNRDTPQKTGTAAALYADMGISATAISAGYFTFTSGYKFTSGYGWGLPDTSDPTVFEDTPIGATVMRVLGAEAIALEPGAYFSVNDFLHVVESNTAGVLTFSPPMRAAVSAGDDVLIRQPTIRLKLASDDGWRHTENFAHHTDAFSVSLVEDFDR